MTTTKLLTKEQLAEIRALLDDGKITTWKEGEGITEINELALLDLIYLHTPALLTHIEAQEKVIEELVFALEVLVANAEWLSAYVGTDTDLSEEAIELKGSIHKATEAISKHGEML